MKVLRAFYDLEDDMYLYNEGDEYPREGVKPSAARIKQLQGSNNNIGEPIIETPKPAKKPAKKQTKKASAKK